MRDKIESCKKCQKPYLRSFTETNLCKDCIEKYPYFLSFIEEDFVGVKNTTFGRLEVYKEDQEYSIDEIRYLFKGSGKSKKEKDFRKFEKRWDFQNVSPEELKEVKRIIKDNFFEQSV